MTPGPWNSLIRPGGYAVVTPGRQTVAELRDPNVGMREHHRNALAIARLPEIAEVLALAEDYFGNLPASNKEALKVHAGIVDVMRRAGIGLAADGE